MAFKIFTFVVALLAVLLVSQTVSCEEISNQERTDVLYIANPDTNPQIISASSALMYGRSGPRNNLVCTALMCTRVCNALGFRFGRCNINRVCVCSNW